jgi:hypothetical protein
MGHRYGIFTKNGWFYGFDTQKCCGIYVQKRENATVFRSKTKAELRMKRDGIIGEVVNLDK